MKTLALVSILFAALLSLATAQSTIFIVRHAEKATDGDAKDPDLSEIGRARAETLAKTLKDANIAAIYATEFKRTQQTAQPIAQATHLSVTTIPAKQTEELVSKLTATKGNSLVVAHSNTIPDIVKALGLSDPIALDDSDYDNLFVIVAGSPPQLLRLHFR